MSGPAHEALTADDLAELVDLYTPAADPLCRVCGGAMSIQAMGGGRATVWACASARYAGGDEAEREHYSASRYEQLRSGDSRVVALVGELVALRDQADERDEAVAAAEARAEQAEASLRFLGALADTLFPNEAGEERGEGAS